MTDYVLRVLPGLAVLGAVWFLLRGRHRDDVVLRVVVAILGFVLIRDAMTPEGFWGFGLTSASVPWIRFADDGVLLVVLGLTSVATVWLLTRDGALRALVDWGKPDWRALLTGLAGAAVVLAPFALLYTGVPVTGRGGTVPASLLPALAVLAYGGNLLEEVLFRGFLQGHLARHHSAARTVLLSGLFFAAGHVFLASTVTDVGWPLLLFTLVEGLVCAEVARRQGVLAATVTHGTVIFVMASGLL